MLSIVAMGSIATGVIVGCAAVYMIVQTRGFLATAIQVDAVIVDALSSKSSPRDELEEETWRPVVEFTDLRGEHQRSEIALGVSHPAWSKGDTISIRYSPTDPKVARIDTFIGLWFPALVCAVLGESLAACYCSYSSKYIAKR